jgi:hypothetical protein
VIDVESEVVVQITEVLAPLPIGLIAAGLPGMLGLIAVVVLEARRLLRARAALVPTR